MSGIAFSPAAEPARRRRPGRLAAWLVPLLLAACGGGDGYDGSGGGPPPAACTVAEHKAWINDYMNEWYFWYRISPHPDPAPYADAQSYFEAWLYTGSSADFPRDRFSGSQTTESFNRFFGDGATLGYGVAVAGLELGRDGSLPLYVRHVEALSPAARGGVVRGDQVISINGRPVSELIAADDFAALSAQQAGDTLTLVLRRGGSDRSVSLRAEVFNLSPVTGATVLASRGGRRVGYVAVKDMISQALAPLETAFARFQAEGVQDVVLDLRYNGGGFLYTALALASMLAPPTAEKKIFERLQFNDKRGSETEESTFFFSSQLQFSDGRYAEGTVLPRLNLPRVYVLTSASTCSASESIVNSLRGVDVEVVLIGANTCGKPYGFSRQDNCGLSYFPIEFQGTNQKGFGDYAGGFAPQCAATDDFDRALGDTGEGMLATALAHLDGKGCTTRAQSVRRDLLAAPDEALARSVADRPQRPGRLWAPSQAGAGLTR